MSADDRPATSPDLPERTLYLVLLALPPAIWMGHFILSYGAVSVWCAKFADDTRSLAGFTPIAATLTLAALAGIFLTGWGGYRRHRHGAETVPHDMDSAEDRHRFLGFATLLLAGLSGIATIFVALAFLFVRTCE